MRRLLSLIAVLTLSVLSSTAWADPRPWTLTYDLYPEGKGNWEYEQWVTWKHQTREESGFDRVEFRHEIEYGLFDNLDISLYAANWSLENSSERTGSRYDGSGIEVVWYIWNPLDKNKPFGFGLYGEVNVGDKEQEYEVKLLFQKNIGNWAFAYNLVFETEVEKEDGEHETTGVLGNFLAASYSLGRDWNLGAECRVECEYEEWRKYQTTTVYAGPTIGYHHGPFWATVTPAFLLTNQQDEPQYMIRLIAGWVFE